MSKYLLEIGTEELPANFSKSVVTQFKSLIEFELDKKLIKYEKLLCTSTPRRIVIFIEGLVDHASDKSITRKGPKAVTAFVNGKPTKAAIGFAKSLDLNVSDLEIKKTDKGDFVFGNKMEKGESTISGLTEIIPRLIRNLQGPRFMKWGYGNFKFSRPIRWIVSLYNNEILYFELDQCDPKIFISNKSRGHRLIKDIIEINDPDDYVELLLKNGVLVKREERKEKIKSLIIKNSRSLNVNPDLSEELINELTDLVEFPYLIIGQFNREFLNLPLEVLTTVMKTHQRYIPLLQTDKNFSKLDLTSEKILSTNFFVISNGIKESSNTIAKGNEKVLKARFSDAKFFVESDKKVPSLERNEKLKNVSYLKGMGNVFNRVERIQTIAEKVIRCIDDKTIDSKKIFDAATYCKSDLTSEIVYEFPELQGIMGGKYLRNEGFDDEICLAVSEHYLPSFYKDELPSTKNGAIISISDKIETLISIFILGKRPSGSSDPYALRRNLNGVIRIIWDFEFNLSLKKIFEELLDFWTESIPNVSFTKEKVLNDLVEFFMQRIVSHLEEIGLEKDLIKAIFSSNNYSQEKILNVLDLKKRIESIFILKEKGTFELIQKVIIRISKLANNGNLETNIFSTKDYVDPNLFEKKCESEVFKFINELEDNYSTVYCDYSNLLNAFKNNIKILEDLFDPNEGVLIMSGDIDVKNNRLNLLSLIRNYSLKIADFTLLNS